MTDPTARETTAAELAEAERMAREKQYASWVLMAEYDERGRELERLRARVAELEPIEQRVRTGEPTWLQPYMQRYLLGES